MGKDQKLVCVGKYPICISVLVSSVCLSFTKQVNYKLLHFCYRRTIRLKQENFSCNNKTNYTRYKFITHKNNCCQVFSRSRNDQPMFVNEYKFKEGWQSSSLKNKFSGFRRAKHKHLFSKSKPYSINDLLRTCEYFNFRWTLRLFYLCFCLVSIDR